ncbi:peptidoglycan-binding protein [Streptomyces sp. NPDC055897]
MRNLITELRVVKERAELGNLRIAAQTGYSTSSWQRYLSGRALPPAPAVQALANAAGVDAAPLLAMHQLASDAWKSSSPTTPGTLEEQPPLSTRRPGRGALLAVVTLVVTGVTLLMLSPWQQASHSEPASSYTCKFSQTASAWHAGLSDTRTAIVGQGNAGPDVAETQCLLTRAGFPLGEIDGMYGPLTERAVKRFQAQQHLVPDGIMGPHTWNALRG